MARFGRKSELWKHFETDDETQKAKCGYCKDEISYRGGATSNLLRHLKRKHPSSTHPMLCKRIYGGSQIQNGDSLGKGNKINDIETSYKSRQINTNRLPANKILMRAHYKKNLEPHVCMCKCANEQSLNLQVANSFGHYASMKLSTVQNPQQIMFAEALITKILNHTILDQLMESSNISNICSSSFMNDSEPSDEIVYNATDSLKHEESTSPLEAGSRVTEDVQISDREDSEDEVSVQLVLEQVVMKQNVSEQLVSDLSNT